MRGGENLGISQNTDMLMLKLRCNIRSACTERPAIPLGDGETTLLNVKLSVLILTAPETSASVKWSFLALEETTLAYAECKLTKQSFITCCSVGRVRSRTKATELVRDNHCWRLRKHAELLWPCNRQFYQNMSSDGGGGGRKAKR
jgi:hypothetical protein